MVSLIWFIVPTSAINELVFGQRLPKVALLERDSSKTLIEREFVPCPHCHTIHSGLKWSRQNNTALRNWFGLYCDNCGNVIPCRFGLASYVLLGLTFPLWYFFKDQWKAKWLEEQKLKFSEPLNLTPPKVKYWQVGVFFGLFMFVFTTIISPLIWGEPITLGSLLLGILTWTIGGFLFAFLAKLISGDFKR